MKALTASSIMKEQTTQMNKFFFNCGLELFVDYRKMQDYYADLPAYKVL